MITNLIIKKIITVILFTSLLFTAKVCADEYTVNPLRPYYLDNRGLTEGTADNKYLKQDGSTPLTGDWNYGSDDITGTGTLTADQGFFGTITAVDGVFSGDIIVTDIYLTTDQGNIQVIDDSWIGLGDSAGRIEFDDQATDEINFLDARVGIGTSVPTAELDLSSGDFTTKGIIDLNPAHTDTIDIISIVPTAPLSTASAEWDGINIDLSALDPSAIDVMIHGIHLNLSGISTAQSPEVEGIHIEDAGADYPAIHIDNGKIRHNFTSSTVALTSHTVYDIIINAASQDATSDTHVIDVALANGLSGTVEALATHPGVDVIHQHVGTFTAFPDGFAVIYTKIGNSYADFTDENIWAADDDGFVVGFTSTFDEIELDFDTHATKDVKLKFYYWKAAGWFEFFPEDDTDGGRDNGTIRFDGADLTDWLSADPTGAAGDTGYWMKIERTRVSDPGTVNLYTHKYLMATEYGWDKVGDLTVNDISGVDATFSGTGSFDRVGIGTTTPSSLLEVKDTGSAEIHINSTGANSNPDLKISNDARAWVIRVLGSDGDKFQIRDINADAQRLTIDTSGNVGIGTDTPAKKLAIFGADSNGENGPHFNLCVDAYPLYEILAYAHDNISMVFDAYFDAGWKSSDEGSNFHIYKFQNKFGFAYDKNNVVGTAVTWDRSGFILDAVGNIVIGGTVTAADFLAPSVTLNKQGATALEYFTTTSEERTLNGKYNHENPDDDLINVLIPFEPATPEVRDKKTGAVVFEAQDAIPEHNAMSLGLLNELQRDAIFELKQRLEALEAE